ncbi:MAG: hypothetical protein K2G96_04520 [Clostridia bacterium]|nr:hypothetical protein [Clostridia bacterium]
MDRFEDSDDVRATVATEVSQSDVYQVLTYARKRSLSDVYLLYPMFRHEEVELESVVGISPKEDGSEPINVHLVRLPFVFEDDVESTIENLRKAITHIFEQI